MIMSSVVIQNSTDTTIPGNDNIQNKKKKTEKIKKKRLFFSKHNHKISNNDNNDVNDDRQHIENHITPVETPSLVNTSSQQPSQTTTTVPAPTSDFSASYRPLDAINENVEYYMLPKSTTSIPIQQQQQQQHQVLTTYDDGQQYFIDSRSLPVYATLRKSHRSHYQEPQPLYYSTDQGGQRIYSLSPQHNDEWKRQFVYGTISPSEQIHYQQPRRIPLSQLPISSSSPSNFQPISPDHRYHHQSHPFSERNETDLVKPTFFIVPKSTEKELTKQLEKEKSEHVTTNSPQLVNNKKMAKEASNKTNKKLDKNKKTNGKISNNVIEIPNKTYRNVEVQTTIPSTINTSPDKVIHQTPPVEIHTINDQLRHVGLTTSPVNSPSPYVHFVTVPQILSDGPPEQSVMQDENIHLIPMMNSPTLYSDYDAQQRSASVRSMPNIAVGQEVTTSLPAEITKNHLLLKRFSV
ncbi:unnamed protein product [Didymodactylos carnosus]|uniref:Uncharacterized protein n=1 Tax=Didymodactylos carnosus TaxID=1234261 RepID=A0A814RN61_9BILA|nr:unnamed protein product [Didymodactylos carnosus]CAF3900007.1 unnamed protein product [Didymodactylos carnosus]